MPAKLVDMETKPHPLEKMHGMTKTVTLPLSGQEVVIRKLDMEVLTADLILSTLRASDLMSVAAGYAKSTNDAIAAPNATPEQALGSIIDQVEALKQIRTGMLREAVIRPTLDELRTEVYGGREDSSDLGMGPDYSFLVGAVEDFNPTEKDGEARKEAAATFPAEVGGSAARDGGELRAEAE